MTGFCLRRSATHQATPAEDRKAIILQTFWGFEPGRKNPNIPLGVSSAAADWRAAFLRASGRVRNEPGAAQAPALICPRGIREKAGGEKDRQAPPTPRGRTFAASFWFKQKSRLGQFLHRCGDAQQCRHHHQQPQARRRHPIVHHSPGNRASAGFMHPPSSGRVQVMHLQSSVITALPFRGPDDDAEAPGCRAHAAR